MVFHDLSQLLWLVTDPDVRCDAGDMELSIPCPCLPTTPAFSTFLTGLINHFLDLKLML